VLTDLFLILFFTGAILLFVRLFVDLWHEICSRYVYTLYLNFCLLTKIIVMVFNATFNNISAISWRSVLLVEKPEYPETITDTDKP
jgi:uncharacterized membrane protein